MTSQIKRRGESFRITWRLGGTRTGAWQGVTLPTVILANKAKQWVEDHGHAVTTDETYEHFVGRQTPVSVTTAPIFADYAPQWLAEKLDLGPRTRKEYAYLLNSRAIPALGPVRIPDITHEMYTRLMVRTAQEVKPATVVKLHAVVRGCLSAAIPRWISVNPCDRQNGAKRRNLPKIERFEAVFLTKEEARLIVDRSSPHITDLLETLLGTGARLGEMTNLECRHVHLSSPRDEGEPYIFIAESKSDAGIRNITISRNLAELLRPRIEGRRPRDLVFTSPSGKAWDEHNLRDRYWKPAVAAARRCVDHMPPLRVYKRGPDRLDPLSVSTCACPGRLHQVPRFHDLRHTNVDWLVEAGWDFDKIRARIGHESIATTINLYGKRRRHGTAADLMAVAF